MGETWTWSAALAALTGLDFGVVVALGQVAAWFGQTAGPDTLMLVCGLAIALLVMLALTVVWVYARTLSNMADWTEEAERWGEAAFLAGTWAAILLVVSLALAGYLLLVQR